MLHDVCALLIVGDVAMPIEDICGVRKRLVIGATHEFVVGLGALRLWN
jgi:hypothetical protein